MPVRKLPIRWPWDVVEEHMASGFVNGHHSERILLFILGDELHCVLQMRESSYHFGNRLHVAVHEGQQNGVQLRCREGFWGHGTRHFDSHLLVVLANDHYIALIIIGCHLFELWYQLG